MDKKDLNKIRIEDFDSKFKKEVLTWLSSDILLNADLISECSQLAHACRIRLARDESNKLCGIMSRYLELKLDSLMFKVDNDLIFEKLLNSFGDRIKNRVQSTLADSESLKLLVDNKGIKIVNKREVIKMSVKPSELKLTKFVSQTMARKLTEDDLDSMSEFYRKSEAEFWIPQVLQYGPAYGVFLEEDDYQPYEKKYDSEEEVGEERQFSPLIAACGVYFVTPQVAEIGHLAVFLPNRRRGFGSLCTYLITKEIFDRKLSELVTLHILPDNFAAKTLAKKLGFREAANLYLVDWILK